MSLRNEISRRMAQFQYAWMGRPEHMIYYGHGLGDDLLCATVAHELKKRGAGRIVMLSRHPSLFEHSPDIAAAYDMGYATSGRLRRWGYNCVVPQFSVYDEAHDRDIFQNEHLLVTMCGIAGVTGSIQLRPYLTLLAREKAAGKLFEKQAVIQSFGLASGPGAMKNKNWLPERYQAVSDQLHDSFSMIQLGQKTDPPIQGALDLRGKTTLRESAAILASSRVFIGQIGFLMHLARAVDCRSVIVYGGREAPEISGYIANENLIGPMPCAPCWQHNRCDFNRECLRMVQIEDVVAAVNRQVERFGTPLEVGQAEVTAAMRETA